LETVGFITQGFLEGNDHYIKLIEFLSSKNLRHAIFNIAFIKMSGINLLKTQLEQARGKLTVFAGIRNGITSIQAIFKLIDMGISVYLVDTGSGNIVYHPKLYFFEYDTSYKIIIGSANLTGGGLNSNIEFSSIIETDIGSKQAKSLLSNIQNLPQRYTHSY
jgi:HKD family nuclease